MNPSTLVDSDPTGSPTIPALGPAPLLIKIARDEQDKPVKLFLSSETQAFPMIWWAPEGKQVKPWHPESVMWVTEDLKAGERILIEPVQAPQQPPFFGSTRFTLDADHPAATTGPVNPGSLSMVEAQLWIYNIVLSGGQLSTTLKLDPVIIIIIER